MRALLIVAALVSVAHAESRRIVVVIDRSAAMDGDRLDLAKTALIDLADTLDPADRIAVVAASANAQVIAPFASPDRARLGKALEALHVDKRALDLGRGIDAAVTLADGARAHAIVIAAGEPNITAGSAFARAHARHVTIATVAVQQASTALDTLAARGSGRAFSVDDLVDLPQVIAAAAIAPAVRAPRAIVFVIDRSFSMRGPRLEAAKEAARATLEKLAPDDQAAIVAFDSDAEVMQALTPLTRPALIANNVARISSGAGTNIFTGLKEAMEQLRGVKHAEKHVVLLTDGEAPSDGIVELCQDMRSMGITIDTVGIGEADRNLLAMIAEAGDGRLFMVEDLAALVKVFERSALP